jgi:hypothetical protein
MVKLTLDELKKSMDDWVKDMNSRVCELNDLPKVTVENTDNIQHNYELITEMKAEIEELKQDIRILKMMQISLVKEKLKH